MAVNNLNTGVGIQPTIVDAKGDLIAATANDAVNRLAVGTNGHVLVADSGETTGLKWNNPGSVGGLVHINSTDSGGASSGINIDNVFSSAFRNYKVFINLGTGSADQGINIRFRVGGADNSTNNSYVVQLINANATTVSANRTTSTLGQIGVYGTSATLKSSLELTIFNPFLATATAFQSHCTSAESNALLRVYASSHNQTTSFDGFSLYPGGGTYTIEKLSVYGIKEA